MHHEEPDWKEYFIQWFKIFFMPLFVIFISFTGWALRSRLEGIEKGVDDLNTQVCQHFHNYEVHNKISDLVTRREWVSQVGGRDKEIAMLQCEVQEIKKQLDKQYDISADNNRILKNLTKER